VVEEEETGNHEKVNSERELFMVVVQRRKRETKWKKPRQETNTLF